MGILRKFIVPDIGILNKPHQKEEYHFLLPLRVTKNRMVVLPIQKNSNTHIGLFAFWIYLDVKNWSGRVKHHRMLFSK